jgi:hypothetical protein
MFRKNDKSKPENPLAARMRQIADRPATADEAYSAPTVSPEGRKPRTATFKQATIQLSTGERMDVVVKNVSDTGARIEYFRKVTLTDRILISEPTLRMKKWAKVMWQTDGAAGVEFID